ncbi:MAG: hypothetical protein PWQ57_1999 [Desulfovibrionales bacterium]|jgi:hypothetical protein|nr:hypothetical protein [Desulfovibrionales bacterium]
MAPHLTSSEALRRLRRVADILDFLAARFSPEPDQPGPVLRLLADELDVCAEALAPASGEEEGGHARS